MRIQELKSFNDVLIVNYGTDNKAVLTPSGAVYDNFKTSDTRNMSLAYAALFDDNWRFATGLELREYQAREASTPTLLFTQRQKARSRSHLTLVKG